MTMAISSAEWWMGERIKLNQAAELIAANFGRAILNLIDPPYPTPDGKPLAVRFYQPGELLFTPQQMEQLTALYANQLHQDVQPFQAPPPGDKKIQ